MEQKMISNYLKRELFFEIRKTSPSFIKIKILYFLLRKESLIEEHSRTNISFAYNHYKSLIDMDYEDVQTYRLGFKTKFTPYHMLALSSSSEKTKERIVGFFSRYNLPLIEKKNQYNETALLFALNNIQIEYACLIYSTFPMSKHYESVQEVISYIVKAFKECSLENYDNLFKLLLLILEKENIMLESYVFSYIFSNIGIKTKINQEKTFFSWLEDTQSFNEVIASYHKIRLSEIEATQKLEVHKALLI